MLAMTLGESNASQAIRLLEIAGALGVDGCTFLPLSTFSPRVQRHPSPAAAEAAQALMERVGDPMIDNSKGYLKGMAMFFRGAPMPGRCSALHTSIFLSPDQRLYPCVPASLRGVGGLPYRPGTLLNSDPSKALAGSLPEDLCRGCWWNCHRELDLALGVI